MMTSGVQGGERFHDEYFDEVDADEGEVIDTTTSEGRHIRTASQRSSMSSSSTRSVTDPPGSIHSGSMMHSSYSDDHHPHNNQQSSFDDEDDSEVDPVFVSHSYDHTTKARGSSGGCCSCLSTRTKCCCALLLAIVIAIGVTAGVLVSQQQTGSPQNSASTTNQIDEDGGSPTPAPTKPDPCPVQLAAMQTCFGDTAAEDACESCVVQYWPAKVDECVDIDDETCAAFADCPCNECMEAVETYVECLSGCSIRCPKEGEGGTLNPTMSPAPTPAEVCPDEYSAFDNCVDPINGGGDCENCVAGTWPPPPAQLSCDEISSYTCTALAQEGNCGCNGCDVEMLSLLVCLSNCTTLECPDDAAGDGERRLIRFRHEETRDQQVDNSYHRQRGLSLFAERFLGV